jgi:protein O-GlcNAc transferase
MGAPYVDYLIADEVLIPAGSREHYSEKVVYLPNSYQVNDGRRAIAGRGYGREELGLPGRGFIYCCFNNNYKITPWGFDGWMRILRRVEGSVLWLLEDNAAAAGNLRREAQRRGVGAERIIFGQRLGMEEHLARHRVADLFLDTLPCNAHTTASDALWAGLPVLTCLGESFAGRVAGSLLSAIRLPELITRSPSEYEERAVELAHDPQRLAGIKEKLARHRTSTALFDTRLYARNLEAAYTSIYERHRAHLPPEHLYL